LLHRRSFEKDFANHTDLCIGHKCGPKGIDWRVNAKEFKQLTEYRARSEVGTPFFVVDWRTVWPRFDPFSECPEVLKQKERNTFAKKHGLEQMKQKCSDWQNLKVNFYRNKEQHAWEEREYCNQKTYDPACGAGEVAYRAFNGQRLEGALHCPAGYKSNIPNDRFDSKCNCDSRDYSRNSEDNAKITLEVP
jgi:hypothetical protein